MRHATQKHPDWWKSITEDDPNTVWEDDAMLEVVIKEEYATEFEEESYEEHMVDLLVDDPLNFDNGGVINSELLEGNRWYPEADRMQ